MLATLLANPTTIKIILALSETERTYKFQLIRMTGAHSTTITHALEILQDMKLVKTVPPIGRFRNVGEFYALTSNGKEVAKILNELNSLLDKVGKHPLMSLLMGLPLVLLDWVAVVVPLGI